MGFVRSGVALAAGSAVTLAVPVTALLVSTSSVRAQAIQPVTCLVHGTAGSEGINPAGASITNGQNISGIVSSNATLFLQSQGANGTSGTSLGGAAGDVSITSTGTIYSPGFLPPGAQGLGGLVIPESAAIWAQSVGGCGYADSHESGHGGTGGNVSVTVNQDSVIQLGPNVAAIYALSSGGQGGGYSHDSNHNVNGGGAAGNVAVTLSGSINVPALPPADGVVIDNAYGIYALSVGGYSGATDNKDSARGGNAGTVSVQLNPGATINMRGDNSVAIYAFSAGGLSWYAENGTSNGHQNGNGGDVSVVVSRGAAITTGGELGVGILAVSTGGNANTSQRPPDSLENGGSPNSVPSTLAPPGNAGNVKVANDGAITTQGDVAIGILAASATGGRGVGLLKENSDGTYEIDQVGQVGPGTGTPGTVTVTNAGTISTSGVGAIGILGLSLGGSGGVMDSKPGLLNLLGSHTAGTGASGNTVDVRDIGDISTTGIAGIGILAESIGGGGGTATGTKGVIAIGTNGGVGGNGGAVSVEKVGGSLTTEGDGAFGILAHSVGGGGGNGANATGLAASVGGAGGASGNGAAVTVTLDAAALSTAGDFAPGIGAQSVGGGGGNGGYAKTYAVSPFSAAVGGSGGAGGNGYTIEIESNGSAVTTSGVHSPALLAQSIGGGGGSGGAAVVYSLNTALTVNTAIGGNGAKGGEGGTVIVRGRDATYATTGLDSMGILAQSIGGGGGTGGSALSRTESLPSDGLPNISISTAVGGSGGSGGAGSFVTVTNIGKVSTLGDGSIGILAQSIGGGGGTGGDASAMARSLEGTGANIKIGVAIGGEGKGGGAGGAVGVVNGDPEHNCGALCGGTITTQGNNAAGILAQSISGGGGNGGIGNGSVSSPNLGGETGNGIDVSIGLGGSGGGGGLSGTVLVNNTVNGLIQTAGSGSQGILAQSVGGGGGNAGGGVAAGSGDTVVMNVALGGSGGSGASAQGVTVINAGTISTGQLIQQNGGAYTTGGDAVGILAQSIGGGGGAGGSSDASAVLTTIFQIENLLNQPDAGYSASVAVGGSGGTGGTGGYVQVTNSGSVTTLGVRAYGILSQSIGGGGGTGGAANSEANAVAGIPSADGKGTTYSATVSVGATGGTGGDGSVVTVDSPGSVLTAGYGAIGILAQSIGGGGGVGAEGSVNNTTTLGIGAAWNGTGAAGGNGGSATVTVGALTTLGDDAHGVVAQSVGGGGGLGGAGCTNSASARVRGVQTTLCYGNSAGLSANFAPWRDASSYSIYMGGGTGASGNGDAVNLTVAGSLATTGARSMGVIAQSIGGGGGLVTAPAANTALTKLQGTPGGNDGSSGAVTVALNAGGSISTTGAGAWGILAQSIYGGGGFAGDPSLPVQPLFGNTLQTSNSVNAAAGAVSVTIAGNILTTGVNAHGIVAQSVGGGGGITNNAGNSGLAFGNSAQIYGTSEGKYPATGGAVTVNQTGGVIQATGAGAIGILAQSTGTVSTKSGGAPVPVINISVGGTVIGGTNTGYAAGSGSGVGAAGIVLSGGAFQPSYWSTGNQIQIAASGSVTTVDGLNGTAILSSGGTTYVSNAGTVTGSVDIGSALGMMANNGVLNSGSLLNMYELENGGTINVAGRGTIGTTTVTGFFGQSASGILAVDIDARGPQQADMLKVETAAAVGGVIAPYAKTLLPGSYAFLSGAPLNWGATAQSSLLFDWGVSQDGFTLSLTPTAHFQPAGVALTPGEASFAGYLTSAWNNQDPLFAPLFGYLSQVGGGGAYKSALSALSPEASQAQATALLNNSGAVLGAALSCPVFTTAGTLLGEDECTWAKVTGSWASQWQTTDTQGFRISQVMYRMGAQKEVAPGWYVGGSLGIGQSWASANNGSSGSGTSYDGSVSIKHVVGPWLFAGSVAVANGSYENSRLVSLPAVGTLPAAYAALDSDSSMTFVGGRLRAGYEFAFPNWYIRPYADLDLVYSNAPGYQEQGALGYALKVDGSSQTRFIFSPMVEIGGRYDLDEAILRPFMTFGISFTSNSSRVVSSSFVGASVQDGTFQTYLNSPSVFGTFSAGVDLYKAGGFEAKAEYGLSGGQSFLVQSGSVRFAYHF